MFTFLIITSAKEKGQSSHVSNDDIRYILQCALNYPVPQDLRYIVSAIQAREDAFKSLEEDLISLKSTYLIRQQSSNNIDLTFSCGILAKLKINPFYSKVFHIIPK